jgi:hypothetical protein
MSRRRGREEWVTPRSGLREGDRTGVWVRGNGNPYTDYVMCNHRGCQKKANPEIADHSCCGRCRVGSECMAAHLGSKIRVRYV